MTLQSLQGKKMKIGKSKKFTLAALNLCLLALPINAFADEKSVIAPSQDNYATPIMYAAIDAKPNFTNSLVKQKPQKLNKLAIRFINFVDETQNAAKSESLSSASKIASFVDNSPSLTRSDTIDGAKALAIISASNSSEFARNLKNYAQIMGKDELVAKLKASPSIVRTIEGYDDAQSNAVYSLGNAFSIIDASHGIISQASYDLQKQKWSMVATDKQPRLHATQIAWTKEVKQNDDATKLNEFLAPSKKHGKAQKVNDKLIAAAAILILTDEEEAIKTISLNSGKFCSTSAYLNLRMCISATKYPFEHSFCLAKHAYSDFEDCAKAALK